MNLVLVLKERLSAGLEFGRMRPGVEVAPIIKSYVLKRGMIEKLLLPPHSC